MIVKRTVTDAQGNFQYSVLHEHCSHSSAAGSFQVHKNGSLICSKHPVTSTLVKSDGFSYLFEDV